MKSGFYGNEKNDAAVRVIARGRTRRGSRRGGPSRRCGSIAGASRTAFVHASSSAVVRPGAARPSRCSGSSGALACASQCGAGKRPSHAPARSCRDSKLILARSLHAVARRGGSLDRAASRHVWHLSLDARHRCSRNLKTKKTEKNRKNRTTKPFVRSPCALVVPDPVLRHASIDSRPPSLFKCKFGPKIVTLSSFSITL